MWQVYLTYFKKELTEKFPHNALNPNKLQLDGLDCVLVGISVQSNPQPSMIRLKKF